MAKPTALPYSLPQYSVSPEDFGKQGSKIEHESTDIVGFLSGFNGVGILTTVSVLGYIDLRSIFILITLILN